MREQIVETKGTPQLKYNWAPPIKKSVVMFDCYHYYNYFCHIFTTIIIDNVDSFAIIFVSFLISLDVVWVVTFFTCFCYIHLFIIFLGSVCLNFLSILFSIVIIFRFTIYYTGGGVTQILHKECWYGQVKSQVIDIFTCFWRSCLPPPVPRISPHTKTKVLHLNVCLFVIEIEEHCVCLYVLMF